MSIADTHRCTRPEITDDDSTNTAPWTCPDCGRAWKIYIGPATGDLLWGLSVADARPLARLQAAVASAATEATHSAAASFTAYAGVSAAADDEPADPGVTMAEAIREWAAAGEVRERSLPETMTEPVEEPELDEHDYDMPELDEPSLEEWRRVLPHEPFPGGGVRESHGDRPRFELLWPLGVPFEAQLLTRCARHMARGAIKYSSRNWESFADEAALERAQASALRHIFQWLSDEDDGDDHAAAVVFNLMAAEHVKAKLATAKMPVANSVDEDGKDK